MVNVKHSIIVSKIKPGDKASAIITPPRSRQTALYNLPDINLLSDAHFRPGAGDCFQLFFFHIFATVPRLTKGWARVYAHNLLVAMEIHGSNFFFCMTCISRTYQVRCWRRYWLWLINQLIVVTGFKIMSVTARMIFLHPTCYFIEITKFVISTKHKRIHQLL